MSNELTLSDAEKVFKSYGCTHFHMYRDKPELHAKYVDLDIPKEKEKEWTKDSFHELLDALADPSTASDKLWWIHSMATTLAEYLKDIEVLDALEQASGKLLNLLPANEAIMCAESILDNRDISQKCSLIIISESLGQPELAKRFIDRAKDFIDHYKDTDESRSKRALERLETTKLMLNGVAPNKLLHRIKKIFAFLSR